MWLFSQVLFPEDELGEDEGGEGHGDSSGSDYDESQEPPDVLLEQLNKQAAGHGVKRSYYPHELFPKSVVARRVSEKAMAATPRKRGRPRR